MSCKKIINSAETAVDDAIQGLILVNNNLTTICNGRVVIRRDVDSLKRAGKVTIVSGGGSGHEPAWAGEWNWKKKVITAVASTNLLLGWYFLKQH